MLKKMPIRLRLTVLSVVLLAVCCVGLTIILNISANSMANVIEATVTTPAQTIIAGETPKETPPAAEMAETIPPSEAQEARNEFLQQSILYMILVVILGGVLTYYISGKALKPLRELSEQIKKKTVHNLSETLPVPESGDELAALTREFNEMSAKLEDAFAMQKRFSQSAAHELRTPLTVLKTKVAVFRKKEEHTKEEYTKLLTVIEAHTNRLAELVSDILSLTNMDELCCGEEIAVKAMLKAVSEELSPLAAAKNISVTISGSEQMIKGNSSLVHRVFYNLGENAIKYNTDGGSVDIRIAAAGRKSAITFSDSGIGIKDYEKALIFEPFYRADKSRARQMGGAGLGLSMVKTIVEQHGGTVSVRDNEARGTVFEVII
ncbi:MAG: ATP-binding protein [Clostridia bacterium]